MIQLQLKYNPSETHLYNRNIYIIKKTFSTKNVMKVSITFVNGCGEKMVEIMWMSRKSDVIK